MVVVMVVVCGWVVVVVSRWVVVMVVVSGWVGDGGC